MSSKRRDQSTYKRKQQRINLNFKPKNTCFTLPSNKAIHAHSVATALMLPNWPTGKLSSPPPRLKLYRPWLLDPQVQWGWGLEREETEHAHITNTHTALEL